MGLSRRGRVLAVLAVLLALLVGLGLLPAVQARVKAAGVLAESLGSDVPRPLAHEITVAPVQLTGVTGDLYRPEGRAPAILLVPGAAPRGRADPRVVRLARALARAGRVVFVPELSLYDDAFDPADIDRLVAAVEGLAARDDVRGRVLVLGFSFGGSFAMVAAADPRARAHVLEVATFGSYFDMVGMIQAASTGWSVVGERRYRWTVPPQAPDILQRVARTLTPSTQQGALDSAFAATVSRSTLPAGARAAYDLVTNTDPDRTYALAARLDPSARRLLDRFSPAAEAARLTAPVLAMHSKDDPAVPYAELARLRAGMPDAATFTVTSFRHVDPGRGHGVGVVRDLAVAWWFTGRLLAAQE